MSFATDLKYLMTNDTSLNGYSEGGIKYEVLPENFDLTLDWIVYSFNKTSQLSCLDSTAALTNYNITVKIISNDTLDLETMSDYLVNYLNGKTYGGIGDIVFTSDAHTFDLEKGVYMNTINFDAIYA